MGTIGIRFACAVGHLHQDKVGRTKRDAVAIYHARRARARNASGWCPVIERREERDRRRAEEARRITLGDYITKSYSKWRETNRAISGWKTDRGRLKILVERFGDQYLDVITPKDVEMFRAALLEKGLARTTANRYGDLLVGIAFFGALATTGAWAGSPHFVSCSATTSGNTLTVDGKEAGLGDEDQIHVVVSATARCINSGGNHPKAVNKASVSAAEDVPVQNGKALFSIELTATFQPECSPPMTVAFTDITVTDTTNNITCTLQ
jgi:hypothetical protein